jgi:hypothetical protein
MGQIGSSRAYDEVLEAAASAQLQRAAEGRSGSDQDRLCLRQAAQDLDAAQAEAGTAAVRLRSPHRKTGLAWEAIVSHCLERPADPLRQSLLTLASTQIVCRMPDLPEEMAAILPGGAMTAFAGLAENRVCETGRLLRQRRLNQC